MSEEDRSFSSVTVLEEKRPLADIEGFEDYIHFEFQGLLFHASANYKPFNPQVMKTNLHVRYPYSATARRRNIWLKMGIKLRGETVPRWPWSDWKCVDGSSSDERIVVQSLESTLLHPHSLIDMIIFVVGETIEERIPSEDEDDDKWAKVFFFRKRIPKWTELDFLNQVETYFPPNEGMDVTIRVKNKTFRAHWNILSSQSPVLSAMYSSTMAERSTGSFSVEDCEPEEFQNLLVFIYSGTIPGLSRGNVMGTYYLADKYSLPKLCMHCGDFIAANLHVDDICEVFKLAIMHCDTALFKNAMAFFCENAIDIIRMRQWKKFVEQYSNEASKIYKKAIASL